jgi:hypothetical protein
MKPPKIFKSLTPLILAALLLSIAAPASHAQRRRTRTRSHSRSTQRTRSTAPRNVPVQPHAAQPSSVPTASQPGANSDARPPASNAVAPRASDADEQRRAPESDSTLEELVGADTYGAYVELRRLGTLAQANELKTAVAGMKLMGETETKPVTDLIEFVTENYEPLAETRAVMLFMAARPRVPEALLALEFLTPQDAAAFEPKYRQFVGAQLNAYKSAKESAEHHPSERGRGRKPEAKRAAAPDYTIRRVGRLIISSEGALSLKRLRGEESAPALADSARFQSARTRFASDSLFVYVDTGVTIQGVTRLSQTEGATDGATLGTVTTKETTRTEVSVIAPETSTMGVGSGPPTPEPTPEETPDPEGGDEGEGEEGADSRAMVSTIEVVKPSEEQMAVAGMGNVMRSLWGGMPRIPGAFALGVRLDGGALALRLAVENSPDGRINVIPFFPNFVAGPPVTAEAAEVAPADADIFFTTSLDWEQLYTSTLGTAALGPLGSSYSVAGGMIGNAGGPSADDADSPKPPTPDEAVAVIEKLFGFKFKEDLIPSLGNEIAFSMPLDANDLGLMPGRRRSRKKEEEKESEAGIVVIVTLNDAEKVQKILPRVLVALGITPFGDRASQTERREGFDIHSSGGLAYTFINRFLVMGADVKAVRHVVDSYAARRTLAATDGYRDSTGWQAPQKLVQAFVSDALMRSTVEETKRRSGASTDPLVRTLLAQLEAPPEAASFETTNEGDAVIHELRVPVSMLQTYTLALMVGARDAPVLSGEMMANFALYEIQDAEETFKDEKKKGRYGTLEELIAEKILERGFAEHLGYQIELNASGEKFDVMATPKEYGKSGRLSFFLDETGMMRAADHKGKAAGASDPPVD